MPPHYGSTAVEAPSGSSERAARSLFRPFLAITALLLCAAAGRVAMERRQTASAELRTATDSTLSLLVKTEGYKPVKAVEQGLYPWQHVAEPYRVSLLSVLGGAPGGDFLWHVAVCIRQLADLPVARGCEMLDEGIAEPVAGHRGTRKAFSGIREVRRQAQVRGVFTIVGVSGDGGLGLGFVRDAVETGCDRGGRDLARLAR